MEIRGILFDGKTADAKNASLICRGRKAAVFSSDDNTLLVPWCHLSTVRITPRLGRTRRVIMFARGERFETDDQEAVLWLEAAARRNLSFRLIHAAENQWKAVLACLVLLICLASGFIRYGIPAISTQIAGKLPPGILEDASRRAETLLREQMLGPTALPRERTEAIRERFRNLTRDIGEDYSYALHFGNGRVIGANALALPSGTIIMTDQLVEVSETDRELEAILVHEITHVTRRHAVRSILQNAGILVLFSLLTGDAASVTGLAAGIPAMLLETGYSREFETEADHGVAVYFMKKGWDIKAYEDILTRLTGTPGDAPGHSFLSTHPDLGQRLDNLSRWTAESG